MRSSLDFYYGINRAANQDIGFLIKKEKNRWRMKMPATQLIYYAFLLHHAESQRNSNFDSFFPKPDMSIPWIESDQTVVFDCADKKICGVCT
ncbi:MAG: hypothetical protein MZV70_54765 [Desulfobacterales bacterium]|nr:hypothetical protein [Desulfobacterales bacterium]